MGIGSRFGFYYFNKRDRTKHRLGCLAESIRRSGRGLDWVWYHKQSNKQINDLGNIII